LAGSSSTSQFAALDCDVAVSARMAGSVTSDNALNTASSLDNPSHSSLCLGEGSDDKPTGVIDNDGEGVVTVVGCGGGFISIVGDEVRATGKAEGLFDGNSDGVTIRIESAEVGTALGIVDSEGAGVVAVVV
jgi:hypothetical protein